MLGFIRYLLACLAGFLATGMALHSSASLAQSGKPIRIGVPTSIQLQVGRDTQTAISMAIEEINAKGGLLGRKLEMVVADETENPEQGIAAIKKLTADEKVDVLIGGYTSGVTLAQLPHIARAKTIYIGVGAASPAITQRVKADYEHYKYIFRAFPINAAYQAKGLVDFISGKLKGEMKLDKIAIIGENAKWVQDLVPILKKGATEAGAQVVLSEFFDTATSDFSPLLAKVKDSGAQYLIVILSHASSDVFVKQWYDARFPIPIGGIDVKSQDADFFTRVSGKAISETVGNFAVRAPLTPKTIPFWDAFVKRAGTAPVYTGVGAYDATHIYAEAVARAKTTDPDAVIKELEKTDYTGVAGRVVFDEMHDVKNGPGYVNLLFAQWQKDGERVIVWPKEIATGKMIAPPWMQ
ncbi:MAG TPA: ABC transporter substrate-binding protein [Ferrovibrio sp.]|uniref:ABC transporter substrate-binding protein n=1 Tax=Ferrovibrio sp. TaxID=1917215 RepID=UPI002ED08D7A